MGHNVWNYDCMILFRNLERHGIDVPCGCVMSFFMDSLHLCQTVDKNRDKKNTLDDLIVRWLRKPRRSKKRHDALQDARYLRDIVFAMANYENEKLSEFVSNRAGRICGDCLKKKALKNII